MNPKISNVIGDDEIMASSKELCNFQNMKTIKKVCAFSSLADKKPTSKKIHLKIYLKTSKISVKISLLFIL